MSLAKSLKLMGPGLMYAAAAIGVSHVVQSTRAGAEFGLGLVWAVVLANFFKYPFFKAGPLYSAATGKSLLSGYKDIGKWAIALFFVMTLGTMFVVQSAVTVVTAGLAQHIFGSGMDVSLYSLLMLALCAGILSAGKFSLLDNFIKGIVAVLTVTTIAAALVCALAPMEKTGQGGLFDFSDNGHLFFLAALIGWMPAPMDIPIWQSVWTVAKQESEKERISVKQSLRDFQIGYIGTAVLALFFLALGSMVMYGSGAAFPSGAGAFAEQFINLYTQALGSWARPIIAIAAFSTMFSTTLACLDAFARITREGVFQWSGNKKLLSKPWYFFWLQITLFGAFSIIWFYMDNMRGLVDFATTLSFVVAPVFALLNYLAMRSKKIPARYRYQGKQALFCKLGIALFAAFTLYYLYLRFF